MAGEENQSDAQSVLQSSALKQGISMLANYFVPGLGFLTNAGLDFGSKLSGSKDRRRKARRVREAARAEAIQVRADSKTEVRLDQDRAARAASEARAIFGAAGVKNEGSPAEFIDDTYATAIAEQERILSGADRLARQIEGRGARAVRLAKKSEKQVKKYGLLESFEEQQASAANSLFEGLGQKKPPSTTTTATTGATP